MDRSYRLKLEEKLNNGVLTVDIISNCIAKNDNRINKLAYKVKQYKYWYESMDAIDENKLKLDELIAYRQPFIDVLMKYCHFSLDEVKNMVSNVKEKNIPTKSICDRVREMIVSGSYWLE